MGSVLEEEEKVEDRYMGRPAMWRPSGVEV
jgi:hypothetical protein